MKTFFHNKHNNTAILIASIAFIITAIGIVIQWASGISNAKVPVGAIVLVIIAVLTFLRIWRWIPLLGVVFSLFILVTAFMLGGILPRLMNPEQFGPFIGTLLQMGGLIVGIISGILAIL